MSSRVRVLLVVVAVLLGLLSAAPVGALPQAKAPKPPKPLVTKVKPASGPVAGGTKVVVKGKNLSGATKVLFGKGKGTKLTVKSARKLTVVAPAQAKGKVHVRVVTKGGKSKANAADIFTYLAPPPPPPPSSAPTVSGVAPTVGPVAGGTEVTVSGTNLTGATSVTFDGIPGTDLTPVSSASLTVVSPAHGAGVVHVRVATPVGTSAVVPADQFEYETPQSEPRAYAAPLPGDADTDEPGAVLSAVDCPAPQECVAVGGYLSGGQRVPLVEQRTGGDSWDFFRPDLPADAAEFAEVDLIDVDCATPTFCVAIGAYLDDSEIEFHPLIETWDGDEWTPSSPSLPGDSGFTTEKLLSDVECPAVGMCVAVGHYDESVDGNSVPLVLALSAGTWTAPTVAVPAGSAGELFAVDCPTAAACVAVGEETTSAGLTEPIAVTGPGPWTVNTSLALPASADPDDPRAGLREVSCGAAGACAAVGSFFTQNSKTQGLVEVLASTAWTAAEATAPSGAATNPQVVLQSVSCASTCAAVGDYAASALSGGGRRPLVIRLNGTTPVVERGEFPDDPAGELSSSSTTVTCGLGNDCLGVGSYDDGSGVFTPLQFSLAATEWTGSGAPVPADISGVLRAESSTLDGDTVAAVGFFTGENGTQQALIMLDLAV